MLHTFKSTNEVLQAAAEYFIKVSKQAIAEHGKFTVALSGGSSPKGLYELLASVEYRPQVDWRKVFFFFGDERNVPADHKDSNALMAKKALFDPLSIAPQQIFTVNTSLEPAVAAKEYEQDVAGFFGGGPISFDLVLLGLGDDAHTASLFPGTDVLTVREAGIRSVFLPKQQVYRITLTARLINQAKHIAFLVFGSSKAAAVHHVLRGEKNYDQYPAQLIAPTNGEVVWFVDEAAYPNNKLTT